jgi:hypothetical protein
VSAAPASASSAAPTQAVGVAAGERGLDGGRVGRRAGGLAEQALGGGGGDRGQRRQAQGDTERAIAPVAELAALLLRSAPGLQVLATSREPLGLTGELLWPVPPLEVPVGEGLDALGRSSAVQLFVERAAAATPGFAVGAGNAAAVASICRRLDGLPLALELAAARIRALGVDQLAARLDDRFRVLARGGRDAPARQQTLRAVIDWSWELLSAGERAVLRRLAVHVDGFTLAAAEAASAGGRWTPPTSSTCSPAWSTARWSSPSRPRPVPGTGCWRPSQRTAWNAWTKRRRPHQQDSDTPCTT